MTIDVSARARVLGIEPVFQDLRGDAALFIPQRIAVIGQGTTLAQATYSNTKAQVFSSNAVGATYGYGSPLHLSVQKLFPDNGDGVGTIPVTVFPLDDDGSAVVAAGDIAPSGSNSESGAYRVRVNNILSDEFVITGTDTVASAITTMTAAINANLSMPVIAVDATPGSSTTCDLTAKWEGASGNDIVVTVEGPALGMTFVVTNPVGGLVNPDVTAALVQLGNIWETLVINCLDIADTTALDAIQTEGDLRWGETVRKPFRCYTGVNIAAVAAATTISDARKTDKVNGQLVEPGGTDLPCVIAARQVARIARVSNNQPGRMYSGQVADTLVPGADADQWTFPQRDSALKLGSSTIEIVDEQVQLSNIATFYHPTGEQDPAYRFDADITKLMTTIYNLDLAFAAADWQGAILVPDGSPAVQSYIKQPKQAIAEVANVLDALELAGIISDAASAKKTITAAIDGQNAKRLNVSVTVQLSGNANIINVTLNFGFFFGSLSAAA